MVAAYAWLSVRQRPTSADGGHEEILKTNRTGVAVPCRPLKLSAQVDGLIGPDGVPVSGTAAPGEHDQTRRARPGRKVGLALQTEGFPGFGSPALRRTVGGMVYPERYRHRGLCLIAILLTVAVSAPQLVPARAHAALTPSSIDAAIDPIPPDQRPITVADAYHGVGIRFCLGTAHPVTIADAYHGVGVAVCV